MLHILYCGLIKKKVIKKLKSERAFQKDKMLASGFETGRFKAKKGLSLDTIESLFGMLVGDNFASLMTIKLYVSSGTLF